jgi:hypothetical protein
MPSFVPGCPGVVLCPVLLFRGSGVPVPGLFQAGLELALASDAASRRNQWWLESGVAGVLLSLDEDSVDGKARSVSS